MDTKKETKYFSSTFLVKSMLDQAIAQAELKRDTYLQTINENVVEIDTETIQFIEGVNKDYVSAVITLTYFLKII